MQDLRVHVESEPGFLLTVTSIQKFKGHNPIRHHIT